jgi:hypothetical protein
MLILYVNVWRRDSATRDISLLFTTNSRHTLGPKQSHIQWVLGSFPLGIKRQPREADPSPPSTKEVKHDGAIYPLPHTSSRGKTLPLPVRMLLNLRFSQT